MPDDSDQVFTLIVEPVKQCNLRCIYCYADRGFGKIMSRRTLQVTLERTARFVERRGLTEIHLLWHGGEPLLAGLAFFRNAVALAASLFSGIHVYHFLQTNGLLLDEDFCIFFREQNFQIGVSLDGFSELHDAMRVFPDGRGSHKRVVDKLRLAEKNRLGVGLNMVATRLCLGREKELYRYFQSLGAPCSVNPLIPAAIPAKSAFCSLRQGEYGAFLGQMFDEWMSAGQQRVAVSPLDIYLQAIIDDEPYLCQQRATCVGSHLGVKPSGDAVLCSRFSAEIIGNLHNMPLEALYDAPLCQKITRRAESLTGCHSCTYWSLCHGGCPHNALIFAHDCMTKDYFCKDYRLIFGKLRRSLRECEPKRPVQGGP